MACRTARICLILAAWLAAVMAQSITPSNWSMSDTSQEHDNTVELSISTGSTMAPLAALLPLTSRATDSIPAPGVSGIAVLTNYSSQLNLNDRNIAVISCDPSTYVGNINVLDVLGTAIRSDVSGIILYTNTADFCYLGGYIGSFSWIYSMKSQNDTRKLLDGLSSYGDQSGGRVYLTVDKAESASSTTSSSAAASSSANAQQNPLGPSPTTAVAMVILYSITGLITGLFLIIIITGAVRAHRHPERYGPRNITGRPRQSRARGLARAMLDTIPIVKFGDRLDQPKPTDVELADANAHGEVREVAGAEDTTNGRHASKTAASAADAVPENGTRDAVTQGQSSRPSESGIAPASPVVGAHTGAIQPEAESEGCSICTEDFQLGEDQRVLPCDHRFHPACIDPWLLNVSGTCPLCRIDLRPQESREPANGDDSQQTREGDNGESRMAPPLAAGERDERRASARYSGVRNWINSLGNPDRMTREERILALRAYRGRAAAQAHRRRESMAASTAEVPEAETRLRVRLRNAFRVRTRRTGHEESNAASASDVSDQPAASAENARQEGVSSQPAG